MAENISDRYKMYNSKQKEEYVKLAALNNTQLETVLPSIFDDMRQTEEALEKDCSNFNVKEILDYYKSRVSRSVESLIVTHSHIKRYTQWCLEHSLVEDNQNHYMEIDKEILGKLCINNALLDKSICSREELLAYIKGDNIRNPYEKFLILGTFEGIGGKAFQDFRNLRVTDFEKINDGEYILHLPGRDIAVSDKLYEIAKASSEEYEYFPYGNINKTYLFDKNDDRIIKKDDATVSDSSYRHWLFMVFDKLKNHNLDNPVFSMAMLKESGRIAMIKKFMKEDNITAQKAISKYKEVIFNQYGGIYAIDRYVMKWGKFLNLD